MSNFNNEVYKALVTDLINDAFYLEHRSRRGTISTIRQYTEVIIRKILGLSNEEFVTVGNRSIMDRLKETSNNNSLLLTSLEIIKNGGNDCTHTQETREITKEDVNSCIDSLFNLYAYLFIAYFEKFEFGKNNYILESFSILPPIIRFITLNYLFNIDKNNINVIDKLSLAILKAFNKNKSFKWLNEHQEFFEKMNTISEKRSIALREEHGDIIAQMILDNAPKNMYILCLDKIQKVADIIDKNGLLYNDFESAIELYNSKGYIDDNNEEIKEFNSIMEFVYLGRKAIENQNLNNLDKYTIF